MKNLKTTLTILILIISFTSCTNTNKPKNEKDYSQLEIIPPEIDDIETEMVSPVNYTPAIIEDIENLELGAIGIIPYGHLTFEDSNLNKMTTEFAIYSNTSGGIFIVLTEIPSFKWLLDLKKLSMENKAFDEYLYISHKEDIATKCVALVGHITEQENRLEEVANALQIIEDISSEIYEVDVYNINSSDVRKYTK